MNSVQEGPTGEVVNSHVKAGKWVKVCLFECSKWSGCGSMQDVFLVFQLKQSLVLVKSDSLRYETRTRVHTHTHTQKCGDKACSEAIAPSKTRIKEIYPPDAFPQCSFVCDSSCPETTFFCFLASKLPKQQQFIIMWSGQLTNFADLLVRVQLGEFLFCPAQSIYVSALL